MASKGKGKGKAKGKGKSQPQIISQKTSEFEGAFDSKFYIKALKQDIWYDARIITCRLLKEFENSKKKKTSASYEYYVHYIRYNRRNDEWISGDRIQMTDNQIPEEQSVKKRKQNQTHGHEQDEEYDSTDEITQFQKTIDFIEIGKYKIEVWYYTPFPTGYQNQECLYFCEFCLSFYVTKNELARHMQKCTLTHPPGDEVYRDDSREQSISMFEVDGAKNPIFSENLGYVSKLFLDHKNLYYNMDPFLFYILTENDEQGSHIVGYFSKQKESEQGWNLNCIMTLPCYQRKGYGKFLITFSYELSLIEGKIGTPETPLSDLGKQTYLSWWTQRIVDYIKTQPETQAFTIKDIEKATGVKDKDIIYTMEQTGLIKYAQGKVAICTNRTYLDKLYNEAGRPGLPVYPDKIHWVPYQIKTDKPTYANFFKYEPFKLLQQDEQVPQSLPKQQTSQSQSQSQQQQQ
ncbi:Chromo domain protein [Pseudocohnilembus persalinus]|uniref:Histone acetyltransferase n=1 Tax=Pseudocohnilembus persalinus TaxID=266149 RepID=A0A0V0QFQ1_PSEPJ|nr:Chromo domain protein [Pseudocohnilembus persalinus]|eukprot:KRX01037.1 Chromo domain protein [Pseudocohnilembus persalinus]